MTVTPPVRIPLAAHIEAGADALRTRALSTLQQEAKSFRSLGAIGLFSVCNSVVKASEDASDRMLAGYLLGLETARAMLLSMPNAVEAGVTL